MLQIKIWLSACRLQRFQFKSVDNGRWRLPFYKLPWSLWLRWAKNLLVSPRVVGTHFKCWGASYQYPQCIRRYQIKIETCFLFNLYHSLGIFSRRQNDVIFLIFPRKQDLTFHANCLLRRQFAWNVKSCFLGKIRKIFQNVVCWKFYPEC